MKTVSLDLIACIIFHIFTCMSNEQFNYQLFNIPKKKYEMETEIIACGQSNTSQIWNQRFPLANQVNQSDCELQKRSRNYRAARGVICSPLNCSQLDNDINDYLRLITMYYCTNSKQGRASH